MSRGTQDQKQESFFVFNYGAITLWGMSFQTFLLTKKFVTFLAVLFTGHKISILLLHRELLPNALGCSAFARRYLRNHMPAHAGYCFIFLRVLKCFTSPGARPSITLRTICLRKLSFLIRKSPDQRLLVTSPKLIADKPRPSSPFRAKASTIRP